MRPGSLAKRSRLCDAVAGVLLTVCLLLAGCGHPGPVLPSVAEAARPNRASVLWQEHAYKSDGFRYVPVRTFLLGRAEDPPTRLTLVAAEQPVTVPPARLTKELVVHFALNSTHLSDEGRQTLGGALDQFRAARQVTVVGYTCSLGSQERNDQLARARAETVAAFLENNGVPVAGVAGRGKCCYVAPNDTEEGRAKNRRVVVSYFAEE